MTTLLQISWRMWQWKNFENRPVFDEVMCRQRRLTFLAHPVRTGGLIRCIGLYTIPLVCSHSGVDLGEASWAIPNKNTVVRNVSESTSICLRIKFRSPYEMPENQMKDCARGSESKAAFSLRASTRVDAWSDWRASTRVDVRRRALTRVNSRLIICKLHVYAFSVEDCGQIVAFYSSNESSRGPLWWQYWWNVIAPCF